jgi:hypothetical protein
MRLVRVARGHRLPEKIKLHLIGIVSGGRAPDVVRTLSYRSEFFGRSFSKVVHRLLRGPSVWSVGERELFAAFVSSLNKCRF